MKTYAQIDASGVIENWVSVREQADMPAPAEGEQQAAAPEPPAGMVLVPLEQVAALNVGARLVAGVVQPKPAPKIDVLTMRQARLALASIGKEAAVSAAIAAMPEPTKTAARITWEYSSEVKRSDPLIAALAPALGLSNAQIDALFAAGAAL